VLLQRGFPFGLKLPNETTAQAITEAKDRKDLKEFDTTEELFEDLDI